MMGKLELRALAPVPNFPHPKTRARIFPRHSICPGPDRQFLTKPAPFVESRQQNSTVRSLYLDVLAGPAVAARSGTSWALGWVDALRVATALTTRKPLTPAHTPLLSRRFELCCFKCQYSGLGASSTISDQLGVTALLEKLQANS